MNSLLAQISRFGGPTVLVLLTTCFSIIMAGTFATWPNISGLIAQQAVPGILAAGVLLPMVAGEFDFSGGSIIAGAAVAMVELTGVDRVNFVMAGAIVLVGCALVGALNGALVAYGGFNSFIATLATSGVIDGVVLVKTNGQTLYKGVPNSFINLGRNSVLNIPLPIVYFVGAFLIVGYALRQTPWGRALEAIGKGRPAAQMSGITVQRHLLGAFVGSAVLAGFAGLLLLATLGSAPPDIGTPYILAAFSAVFLGSTMLRPTFFNATGTFIAILLIAVTVNGLTLAGVSSFVGDIVTGGLLFIAIGISRLEQLRR
jgi:ribose transport system permease protein